MSAPVVSEQQADPTAAELRALQTELGAIFTRWRERCGAEGLLGTQRFHHMVEAEVALGRAAKVSPSERVVRDHAPLRLHAKRCGVCRVPGHRADTCPQRRAGGAE